MKKILKEHGRLPSKFERQSRPEPPLTAHQGLLEAMTVHPARCYVAPCLLTLHYHLDEVVNDGPICRNVAVVLKHCGLPWAQNIIREVLLPHIPRLMRHDGGIDLVEAMMSSMMAANVGVVAPISAPAAVF